MKKIDNACRKCRFFDPKRVICSIPAGSPIRQCVVGINIVMLEEFNSRKGLRILEIGCGTWSPIKSGLRKDCEWRGIDVERMIGGKKTIATEIASVDSMPYEDGYFDLVMANESAEHWFEYGVSMDKAIHEISRVLKKGGRLYLNVPVHLHGDKRLILGKADEFIEPFKQAFRIDVVEDWRKDPHPLPDYRPWESDLLASTVLGEHRPRSAYILNIKMTKVKESRLGVFSRIRARSFSFWAKAVPFKARMAAHYGIRESLAMLSAKIRRR